MQHTPIFIDDRPFCFWDHDLKGKNIDFLEGFDPNYFGFLANSFYDIITDEDQPSENQQYAAIGIRNTYSHASETLFAILFGSLQAYDFIPGWLYKYRPRDLYSLIEKFNSHQPFRLKITPDELSWNGLSNMINQFETESAEHTLEIKNQFGLFLQRTASQYLDDDFRKEYNSIKHGLRVKPGGFKAAFGIETIPGKPTLPENMQSLGGSLYGSSFFTEELPTDDSRNIRLRNKSLNWIPKNFYLGVKLICELLSNIKSFLLTANRVDNTTLTYHWPSNIKTFEEQFRESPGILSMNFDLIVNPKDINTLSKNEITELFDTRYKKRI